MQASASQKEVQLVLRIFQFVGNEAKDFIWELQDGSTKAVSDNDLMIKEVAPSYLLSRDWWVSFIWSPISIDSDIVAIGHAMGQNGLTLDKNDRENL